MGQEPELYNFSDDSEDDVDSETKPDTFSQAVLYGTDWTVRTILQQIENGNIDLAPDFQRKDAWSNKNKSRFIESVALQLPIPQIVLAEKKQQRGTYIVLDGKQRLLTLAQFAANLDENHPVAQEFKNLSPLKINGLKILKGFNHKTYTDIIDDPSLSGFRIQFDNHSIRSAIIRNWPNEDYLYDVFIRLNTGSAKLSTQELRQALEPGEFTNFLSRRSSESKIIQAILGLDGPDFRMRDVDLLLRMIAFSFRFDKYKGNLKDFLDETQNIFNRRWEEEKENIIEEATQVETALEFLVHNFGTPIEVGRRWKDNKFEPAVNRAMLDVQLASVLPVSNRHIISNSRVQLRDIAITLCQTNSTFVEAISGTTKSIIAIESRFSAWKRAVQKACGQEIDMPGDSK
ncbi:DUF262 domain-containing protein [Acidithiobacillus caldus]